jgi:hypothetical protein
VLAIALILSQEPNVRTPAIYRMDAKDVRLDRLEAMTNDDGFDGYCIEPKPSREMKAILEKGKVKSVDAKAIDTKANLAWRNATVEFAAGRISPRSWLAKTKNLGETVHFLTSPKTKSLREALGEKSYKSVFAEMLMMSWKGRLCLTSTDIWQARWWPENDKAMESWILAMNDYMGPMLYHRFSCPYMVKQEPKILSAPDKPGLFIFSFTDGVHTETYYFNNSNKPVRLPRLDMERAIIIRGLQAGDETNDLSEWGSMIVEAGPER